MTTAKKKLKYSGWYCALLAFSYSTMASQVHTQSVQCCNLATGDFSKSTSEAACKAKPGHVPATAQNMNQIIICLQKTQQMAQEYIDDNFLNSMHKDDAVLPNIPMGRFAPAYAPAYVLPRHDMLKNPKKTVPFMVNYYEDGNDYLRSIYAFDNAQYHQDDQFWLAYLLNAFQGIANEDGPGAITGQADEQGNASMGAAIYQESGLESEQHHKAAQGWRIMDSVPHETAHLFGGTHEDGDLMAWSTRSKTEDFTDKTLNVIHSANHP